MEKRTTMAAMVPGYRDFTHDPRRLMPNFVDGKLRDMPDFLNGNLPDLIDHQE
jgi:hypothetical protein